MSAIRIALVAFALSAASAVTPAVACSPYGAIEPTVLADSDGAERVRWDRMTHGIEVRDTDAETGWKTVLDDKWVSSAKLENGRIHVLTWDGFDQRNEILALDGTPVSEPLADAPLTDTPTRPTELEDPKELEASDEPA